MTRARRGFTLVELAIATAAVSVLAFVVWSATHAASRGFARGDLSLDQLGKISQGSELIARDVREARQVIHPAPGALPSPFLYLRNFEGQIVCWYAMPSPGDPGRRDLRRATLLLQGLPVDERMPAATGLDGILFSQTASGVVSWGMFVADGAVLGAAGRKNQ